MNRECFILWSKKSFMSFETALFILNEAEGGFEGRAPQDEGFFASRRTKHQG